MATISHHKGLYISYLFKLSDVEKCKIVTKYSFNVLFLASGVGSVQGCVTHQGDGGGGGGKGVRGGNRNMGWGY